MKKLILFIIFLAQGIVAQEPKVFTDYNSCEIYPKLLNGKDFIKEISKIEIYSEQEEVINIHFYISKEGDFFAISITNREKYYEKLHKALTKLGKWSPGEFNGEKVIVRVKFKITVKNYE